MEIKMRKTIYEMELYNYKHSNEDWIYEILTKV